MRVEFYAGERSYGRFAFDGATNVVRLAVVRKAEELRQCHAELRRAQLRCRVLGAMGLTLHPETEDLCAAITIVAS